MAQIIYLHYSTSIDEVAKFFRNKNDPKMTHKKLQKLCYYAYAWFLALYGERLFPNRFQAWVHGPVDPVLYQAYKNYGWRILPPAEDDPILDEEIQQFLEEVYESYGALTGEELSYLSKREEPWILARGNCGPTDACTNPLQDEVIERYYQTVLGQE